MKLRIIRPADPDLVRARFNRMDPTEMDVHYLIECLITAAPDQVDKALDLLEQVDKSLELFDPFPDGFGQ